MRIEHHPTIAPWPQKRPRTWLDGGTTCLRARAVLPLAIAMVAVGLGAPVSADTGSSDAVASAAPAAKPVHAGAHATAIPFRPIVDMATFMDHVLTPAAMIVWRTNGYINDASGEHDLAPASEADWEHIESGAATLAEATNALLIPQRVRDRAWNGYVVALAALAERAYRAAERHDLQAISAVSDELDGTCSACHHHYGLE